MYQTVSYSAVGGRFLGEILVLCVPLEFQTCLPFQSEAKKDGVKLNLKGRASQSVWVGEKLERDTKLPPRKQARVKHFCTTLRFLQKIKLVLCPT